MMMSHMSKEWIRVKDQRHMPIRLWTERED